MNNHPIAGAEQSTPGIPQYFSWINNTNEGSTEEQTLINLDFFGYMKEKYGMQIEIYAWDAGNFDGASEGYGNLRGEKFKSQYPEGYKNVVKKADSLGIKMGLWGSPDGFGDTPEEEKERFDFYVHLCRDYGFNEFKLDGVCGRLRPEKADVFGEMLKECRKYCPGLIVLNHRLELYEAKKYVTTFLWNGEETYTDVFAHNRITAMHNRAYTFSRGNVEGLNRLAEDHGVCLSSSLDYFEDDLVYQAFGRNLILSPETYGNPWFLRDDELPRLARIYNLHRQTRDILVNGELLSEEFGANAVIRGNFSHKIICTGNDKWETKTLTLAPADYISGAQKAAVAVRFPHEKYLGEFEAGQTVTIELLPFRACLIEIASPEELLPVIKGCEYAVITENGQSVPEEIKIVKSPGGELSLLIGGKETPFGSCGKTDEAEKAPQLLCSLNKLELNPADGGKLYDIAAFAADNDSLEKRCIKRSGETQIKEVAAAREAFFNQKTYRLRGCEAANMFDGRNDTFFDGQSRSYCGGFRDNGGCLRIDFGAFYDADTVEITCFSPDIPTAEAPSQIIPASAYYGTSQGEFSAAPLSGTEVTDDSFSLEAVKFRVHTTYTVTGKMLAVRYAVKGGLRYFKADSPMDRIYGVALYRNGEKLNYVTAPSANNLMSPVSAKNISVKLTGEAKIPVCAAPSYLAVALGTEHGNEGAYCVIETEDGFFGCPRRAPDFKANVWEHIVCSEDINNTYFIDVPEAWYGKTVKVHALFTREDCADADCKVWLCPSHRI